MIIPNTIENEGYRFDRPSNEENADSINSGNSNNSEPIKGHELRTRDNASQEKEDKNDLDKSEQEVSQTTIVEGQENQLDKFINSLYESGQHVRAEAIKESLKAQKRNIKVIEDDSFSEPTTIETESNPEVDLENGENEVQKDFNPISTQFTKLQAYSKKFSLEDILTFEFLLMMSQAAGNDFFYQGKRIENSLRIKRTRFEKSIKFLKKMGVLETLKGPMNRTLYRINFEKIIDQIPQIYDLDKENRKYSTVEYAIEAHKDFFMELEKKSMEKKRRREMQKKRKAQRDNQSKDDSNPESM